MEKLDISSKCPNCPKFDHFLAPAYFCGRSPRLVPGCFFIVVPVFWHIPWALVPGMLKHPDFWQKIQFLSCDVQKLLETRNPWKKTNVSKKYGKSTKSAWPKDTEKVPRKIPASTQRCRPHGREHPRQIASGAPYLWTIKDLPGVLFLCSNRFNWFFLGSEAGLGDVVSTAS